jgi:uncharacterized membrane protein (Fun14 family)
MSLASRSALPALRCCSAPTVSPFTSGKLIGITLALSCAILFALGNVLNRAQLPMPPLVVVAWQVGLGCLVMLVLGIAFEHPDYAAITPTGVACFVYMTLVPMGLCYLTWFETLRRLPPTSASTGMLLVPVIGVVSAAFILGEPLGFARNRCHGADARRRDAGAAEGIKGLKGLLNPVWAAEKGCNCARSPINVAHSISRCAFLNAPAGYFPKTSTS